MKRTLVKTITYRSMNSVYAFTAGMLATGKVHIALTLVGAEVVYKMFAYFAHESLWESTVLKGVLK